MKRIYFFFLFLGFIPSFVLSQSNAVPPTNSFVNRVQTIQLAPSTVEVISLNNGIYPDQSTTLTATVSVSGTGPAPTGTVTIMLGAAALGSGALSPIDPTDSSADFTLNGSQLAAGANSIKVVY